MSQNIYFDESGFTGSNLLQPDQKYFAYASVVTDDQEARIFVESLIRRYQIQTSELKGRNLVKHLRGRKVIDEILTYFSKRLKLSISDKKLALACKFHEYIFEPCYSTISSLFYEVGFHRFIANILYLEFVARGAGAEEIFHEFEDLMRTKNEARLNTLFSSSVHPETSPMMTQICEFAQYRADDIRIELGGVGADKWILDLTQTALFTLLANWGTEYDEITAICDPSKPLQENQGIFNAMIGRRQQEFSDAFGQRHPLTFNLSGPLQFPDSKVTHGIQISDAVAAAAVYVFSRASDEYARSWRRIIASFGNYGSILPEFAKVNPRDIRAQRNAVLLNELHSRAEKGQSLIDGMAEFVHFVHGARGRSDRA